MQPGTLAALLVEYPGLRKHLPMVNAGDYSVEELFDFNPFANGTPIQGVEGEVIGDIADGNCMTMGVELVQLDEMYKASLIVKAQIALLVRLEKAGATFGYL